MQPLSIVFNKEFRPAESFGMPLRKQPIRTKKAGYLYTRGRSAASNNMSHRCHKHFSFCWHTHPKDRRNHWRPYSNCDCGHPICSNLFFAKFLRFLKKNLTILERFWRFEDEFYKNRALKATCEFWNRGLKTFFKIWNRALKTLNPKNQNRTKKSTSKP